MKKCVFALIMGALVPVVSFAAYNNEPQPYFSDRQTVKTSTYKTTNTNRKSNSGSNYYTQSGQRRTTSAKTSNTGYSDASYTKSNYYNSSNDSSYKKQKTTVRKSYATQERKFFLAHPFFQPLKGHVGSVTDFSYAQNRFNFDVLNGNVFGLDPNITDEYGYNLGLSVIPVSGKQETSQFVVKEDLSYGLTDSLALVLMAQYDKTKVSFKDWSGGEENNTNTDSGLNLFGIGLQNRFVDDTDWIVMGELFFQHQKDTANTLIGTVKAGYKVDRTTFYGLGRVAYTNLIDGDIYGAYVKDNTGDWLALTYHTNVKDIFQFEGGLGAFAVLNKYFTLNGEMVFGYYDWHNQLNIKGAIGWQPADMFALNLYASTAIYDSAKGKTKEYMNYDVNPELPSGYYSTLTYTNGDYKIKDYNEWKIGVQAILHF